MLYLVVDLILFSISDLKTMKEILLGLNKIKDTIDVHI